MSFCTVRGFGRGITGTIFNLPCHSTFSMFALTVIAIMIGHKVVFMVANGGKVVHVRIGIRLVPASDIGKQHSLLRPVSMTVFQERIIFLLICII